MGEIRVYRKKKTGILLTVLLLVTVVMAAGRKRENFGQAEEFERKMDTGSLAINGEGEKFPKELAYMLRDTFLENGWRGVRELLDAGEQSRGREEADISGRKPGTETGLAWDRVSALTEEDIFQHFPLIEEYRDRITYEYEPYDAVTFLYDAPKDLYDIYYLPESAGGDYVFVYSLEGNGGKQTYSVRLADLTENGLVTAAEFAVQDGNGRIFQYEGEYYYIYGWRSDFPAGGEYDGFMLHGLTDPERNALLGRYTPEGNFVLTEGELFAAEKKKKFYTVPERRRERFGYIVYDNFWDFEEERNLPFADDGTVTYLEEVYAAIEFRGEFRECDAETNAVYREAFRKLVQNMAVFHDPEKGQDFFLKDYEGIAYDIEEEGIYDPGRFAYYFFDADGDGAPELGILEEYPDGHSAFLYQFQYDAETGKYSLWNTLYPPYDHLLGTRKVLEYDGVHMKIDYGYYELDRNGEAEYSAYLYYLPLNLFEQICLVMLPAHTDPSLNEEVMEEVKQCGIYARETGKWYFRVTEEQFWALADAFEEALESAREQEKNVLFTYEELFGQS